MTIQLDNGTTLEINENMISITNGFRGFTWDLNTNELHRATDTVIVDDPENTYLIGQLSKLLSFMSIQLEEINSFIKHNPDFKGLLGKNDLDMSIYNLHERVRSGGIEDGD